MTETETPKRRAGRPKGIGKVPGSGRRKGSPNKDRAATLEEIRQKINPIEYLGRVSRGLLIECRDPDSSDLKKSVLMRPTMEQRTNAATILSKKILPDSKAVELEIEHNDLIIHVNLYPHGPDKQTDPDATPPGDDGGTTGESKL